MINKFEEFSIQSIPRTKNFDIDMLINVASNLNLYDGSIDKKFSVEICRSSIPSTQLENLKWCQHIIEHLQSEDTSKGSIIN